ncbi:MAG: class I SAM-dependent methyltransferase [Alphaproteobacteria bacterium]|nr:class I SAM-dependent methyltransferase [Alphaproteobacteria bacterium]
MQFSQQNAEATDFADGYFDLVVSLNMIHETSNKAFPAVMRETHRLLAPGGRFVHNDIASKYVMGGGYPEFAADWSTHYNAEPFISRLLDLDHCAVAAAAGVAKDKVEAFYLPPPAGGARRAQYVLLGRK